MQDVSSRHLHAAVNDINNISVHRVFNRATWKFTATVSNIFWVLYKVFHYAEMVGDDLPAIKVNNIVFYFLCMGIHLHILYIKIKEIHPHIQPLLLHRLGKYTVADCTAPAHLRIGAGIVCV